MHALSLVQDVRRKFLDLLCSGTRMQNPGLHKMSIVLLPDEIEVRFRFHDAFGFPVCLWKKSNYENRIRIGITASLETSSNPL